ncbi:hypothetical protein H0H87_008506 [Tephrocybe sp. NHM501043]|nr:hypothetical protein H0H87_008506 [Tephrocybe sp. NHM501043]
MMISTHETFGSDIEKDAKKFASEVDGYDSGDDIIAQQIAEESGAEYPELRDICDIGQKLFGGSVLAYNITVVFFILNNTFIQGAQELGLGPRVIYSLSHSTPCSCGRTAIEHTLELIAMHHRVRRRFGLQMSYIGLFSAVTMGIGILLTVIFAGVQSHPAGYIPGSEPIVTVIPLPGTTFIQGMSAFLNITYTFVGQATLPSFIAEMKNPKEFPKGATAFPLLDAHLTQPFTALIAVTIAEIISFTLCGAIVYHFVGNQYMTAPAVGSLQPVLKKIAFSFAIPTIIFLGALYSVRNLLRFYSLILTMAV